MAYERKEGQGSLFQNTRKSNDRQPDYQGDALYKGELLRIAGWKRKSQSGNVYVSLTVEPAQQGEQQQTTQQTAPAPAPQRPAPQPKADDDLPF